MPTHVRADGGAPLVSVVVPVFNEEEGLPELQRRMDDALRGVDGGYEVVYVDDGSTDASAALLEALAREREDVVLVRLSRRLFACALPRPSATASAMLANRTVSQSQTAIAQMKAREVGEAVVCAALPMKG